MGTPVLATNSVRESRGAAVVMMKPVEDGQRDDVPGFKFLSGAALAGSFANVYLWFSDVSVPFLGCTITPHLLGARAAVQFGLFVVFLHFGWLRE